MKKNNLILIILVGILLSSNLFFGYMLFFHKNGPGQGFQDMQLTDAQKQAVTSFFNSTTDTAKITDYCNQNRMECFYYCRTINPSNSYCSELMKNRPISQPSQ
jgi:hypothetical protein